MGMIRMTQMMEQTPAKEYWREEMDDLARACADRLEPLLSPEGEEIGWYDHVQDQEFIF